MLKKPLAGLTARARSILGVGASQDVLAALADADDLKPAANAGDDAPGGDGDPAEGGADVGEGEGDGAPASPEAITEEDVRAAHALGVKTANARVAKVFASEHSKGRERLAVKLLGNAEMSADAIIDVLQDTKAETAEDPGAAMVQQLAIEQPPALGSGSDGGDRAADSAAVWDKAIARNFPGKR